MWMHLCIKNNNKGKNRSSQERPQTVLQPTSRHKKTPAKGANKRMEAEAGKQESNPSLKKRVPVMKKVAKSYRSSPGPLRMCRRESSISPRGANISMISSAFPPVKIFRPIPSKNGWMNGGKNKKASQRPLHGLTQLTRVPRCPHPLHPPWR